MTKLTTHCLDTFSGRPAKGIKVDVYLVSDKKEKINSVTLYANGRSDRPLVEGSNFKEHSVSSKDPKIHETYKDEDTYHISNFTHKISTLN